MIPVYKKVNGVDAVVAHATVDDDDFQRVAGYARWRLHNYGYAYCKAWIDGERKTILMHRFILGVNDRSIHIDHKDHDTLNNQRYNIVTGTQTDNNKNPTPLPRSDSSSRYKGVGKYRGGWRAQGWKDGKTVWLGKFPTEEEAKIAYDEWRANECLPLLS